MTKAGFGKIGAGLTSHQSSSASTTCLIKKARDGRFEWIVTITFNDEDAPPQELLDLVVETVAKRYPGFSGVINMRWEPMA